MILRKWQNIHQIDRMRSREQPHCISIHFYGYKRLQNLILMIFRNHDFSELVFLNSLMICFLNGHSEISSHIQNSQTLLLMYWTLNSDKISKISRIAKHRTRDSDFVFLHFCDVCKLRFVNVLNATCVHTPIATNCIAASNVVDIIFLFDSMTLNV